MLETFWFLCVLVLLIALAAALWFSGAPEVEPQREHMRIRAALEGGALEAIEWRSAA